jgi:hypothetical protein
MNSTSGSEKHQQEPQTTDPGNGDGSEVAARDAAQAAFQKKYLLIPKRGLAVGLGVLAVLYLLIVLSSEFVFSVSYSSEAATAQFEKDIQRIPCASDNYRVDAKKVPKRNPWLLEGYRSGGLYLDVLFSQPGCAARSVVGTPTNPHGKFSVYYFDRATDKPVIKVTYESLK